MTYARILLPFLFLGLVCACEQRNVYQPPPPPKVTVAKPTVQAVTEFLEFTGNAQALESVDLTARVEGFLQDIRFKDGQMVRKGEPLFVIEPRPYEIALQDAKSEIVNQEAKLSRAETEFGRAQKLFKEKAAPESEVVRWEKERDSARAAISQARVRAERAEINLGYARLTAPFDGRIGRRLVDKGNLVGPGGVTKLATVQRIDPIYAYFTVNERDLLRLERARKVNPNLPLEMGLADEDGYPRKGRLDFVDLGLDPTTGALILRGTFENSTREVLPGMFLRLRAPIGGREGALLVTERALASDQAGPYVLVVGDKNVVEQRPVVLGTKVGGMRVIEKGLEPADRVIVTGLQRARPGATVDPEAAPQAAPKKN